MQELLTTENLISLLTLTFLEIILGIDNVVFISILAGRLPAEQQGKARNIGLALALFTRVGLLLGISVIISLKNTLFTLFGIPISWRDLILIAGGLFLLGKSTSEIHHKLEGDEESAESAKKGMSLGSAIIQIIILDMVFSFDSILTAVGLVDQVEIMIAAVIISIGIMLLFAGKISGFINKHPSMKMLALSFLILIGVLLVVEGLHQHVSKGYVYFAMAFSLGVELLNMKMRKKSKPVQLRKRYPEEGSATS
jgi:predicted tellurium resistance membrane protein TerC